ncbi:MAG: P-type conjugative transfer protein TrbG [Rhodobacteraceae bacterium]|nr:P-type conjugative transfer protein TrbG [Paracoccaceae bacterium]
MNRSIAMGLLLLPLVGAAHGLKAKDRAAVALSTEWIQKANKPAAGENGEVVYTFGQSLPTLVCAPLRACDVRLQPGEKVKRPLAGDTSRWIIAPATSGRDGDETTHVVIKPKEAGLDTNLIITTDRRTYHIRLVSTKTQWMPAVSFTYPEDSERQWADFIARQEAQERLRRNRTLPGVGLSVDALNFAYDIEGESHWRPLRVFDDGVHTYIDLPREATHRDAPVLLVKDDGGDRLVNYRLKGARFIVDALFDEAVLISGVGRHQERVTVERR